VFDRSAPLPTGGHLEQADGTAWMALFSQNMIELAVELAAHDPSYEDMVAKFVEHFYFIALGMNRPGADGMWDEEDGFYYDVLRLPDGRSTRLKVRSMVGLLPLAATTVVEKWQRERVPRVTAACRNASAGCPNCGGDARDGAGHSVWPNGECWRWSTRSGSGGSCRRCSTRTNSSGRTASGRSRSSTSAPVHLHVHGQEHRVDYLPAESTTGCSAATPTGAGPSGCRST
jgi:hypothetical protein